VIGDVRVLKYLVDEPRRPILKSSFAEIWSTTRAERRALKAGGLRAM
jgi:hypothetical protein